MKKWEGFGRLFICILLMCAVFLVFSVRLVKWQLVEGDTWEQEADDSYSTSVIQTAARGEIFDSAGNVLVSNRLTYNLVFHSLEMPRASRNETIYQLILLLEQCNATWIDELPIELDASGNYVFKEDEEYEIEYMKSSSCLNMNSYASAQDCVNTMLSSDFFNISDKYPKAYALKIASVRYNMLKKEFSASYPYTFASDLSIETISIISEHLSSLSGVKVEVSTAREYTDGTLAPHILGTTGALSLEEYTQLKADGKTYSSENISGYAYNDRIGKGGIELAFEDELRGENGKKMIRTDTTGSLVDASDEDIAPVAGNSIYLTLNSTLQQVANLSLGKNVLAAQANGKLLKDQAVAANAKIQYGFGEDCVSGAAVVLRVSDFAVLASSTFPSYDLNKSITDADYYASLVKDETTKPLLNRVTSGTYTPGSIFKPAVALAALQEGIITTDTTVYCGHTYKNPDFSGYEPECLGTHGSINVFTALQKSCNIFFYEIGYRLGIEKMNLYCRLLGLGEETGVEIYERKGILANPDEFSQYHDGAQWTGGITVQAAIGQSDNSFTPMQLASYVATIANNGTRLKAHYVDKIVSYDGSQTIFTASPVVLSEIGVDQAYIDDVKYAMSLVPKEGGTGAYFADYGIAIAAKTGTATTYGNHSDNATFIAFAPYENPQIAVAIVLEYGAKGTYAMNIAKDIFDAYFYGKTASDLGLSSSPSTAS